MQGDWKKTVQQEAAGLLGQLKAICASQKWVANGDSPCLMYKMEVGNRLASKGIAVVNHPYETVLKFFSDPKVSSKINEMIIKSEIIYEEEGKKFRVLHLEHQGHWPVSNRDFIIVSSRIHDGNSYYLPSKSCSYPHPEQKDVVRGEIVIAGYMIEKIDEKSTRVTYVSNNDPKGNIPDFLKNALAVKQGQVAAKVAEVMKK